MPDITDLVADGELLQRSGSTVVGYDPASAGGGSTSDPLGFGFPMTAATLIGGGVDGSTVFANRAWYARVIGGGTISAIGLHVATSSGNICVGVYSPSGTGRAALPGTQKATSGSVACPSSGFATVALTSSIALDPGDFLALVADNTTATFRQARVTGGGSSNLYAGINYLSTGAEMPLPATAGAMTAAADRVFALVGIT